MKTLKFKFFVPVLAVAFAVTSAFTTSASSKVDAFAPIAGYIDSPAPCMTPPVNCSTTGFVTCKNAQGQQVFGKEHPLATTCPRLVFKN